MRRQRSRYLNATKTLSSLLNMGVIPIVNENDTIAVQEIRFGDNDTLSAITAGMVAADYLFLLTDVDCLYTENPRKNPSAKAVRVVRDIESVRRAVSTATLGSSLGTGGMETKLIAAELATGAGVATVITHSAHPERLAAILAASDALLVDPEHASADLDLAASGELPAAPLPLHTLFVPQVNPLADRRWWVMHGLAPRGRIVVDAGAHRALSRAQSGGRLLAAGIVAVEGSFAAGQAVRVAVRSDDSDDVEIGRGLANYNWQEVERIKGLKRCVRSVTRFDGKAGNEARSSDIEGILGYIESEHVVESITLHRSQSGTATPTLVDDRADDHRSP
jgi:glutamate 5-kinase